MTSLIRGDAASRSDPVPQTEADRIDSYNPATGELVGSVPVMGRDDVSATVAKARLAAAEWAGLELHQRGEHLRRVRQSLVDYADRLARLASAETGKPVSDAYFEVFGFCVLLAYVSRAAPRVLRPHPVNPWPVVSMRVRVEHSPYGVIGEIAPWNIPIAVPGQTLSMALAAGNTVVLKPSELTPLTGLLLAEAVNAAGRELVFVVTGYGATGEALVRSGVDKVAFTGSPATGRRILKAAAESLTPTVMELGGKDPMIVSDHADVRRAAVAAVGAAFWNAGQACVGTERVFVTPGAYDRFVAEVLDAAGKVRQGIEDDDHIGATTRGQQIDVIERRLADAQARGAKVLVGGRRKPGPGTFFEPTVVVDVTPDMELMREETFGPVLPIMRVESVEEAVRLANDSDYGLNASVFSNVGSEARWMASALVSGGVNINDAVSGIGVPGAPFGGEKWSGFGRLQGKEGLLEFSRVKSVAGERFPGRLPSMIGWMMTGRRPKPEFLHKMLGLIYSTGVVNRVRALWRTAVDRQT
jgi:acyl-CoA reductase-like NAD-dependent aldehyde dehydrogenase